jgi:hypothetical protein
LDPPSNSIPPPREGFGFVTPDSPSKWRGLTKQELQIIAVNDAELNDILNFKGQLSISKQPEEEVVQQTQKVGKGKEKEVVQPYGWIVR